MGPFMSYIKDKKMISKCYPYHLIKVKDSSLENLTLESVSVVCEFPEDLLWVPPGREWTLELISYQIHNIFLLLLIEWL